MQTKILIVDDSLIFRKAVEESLSGQTDMQVVGSVRNGVKALEFIRSSRPDLVTLDVEMPEMGGLETLHAIQEINRENPDAPPVGVIMLSAHTRKGADTTIAALEAGAFDFITKPKTASLEESSDILRRQLLVKIRYFASRRFSLARPAPAPAVPSPPGEAAVSSGRALFIGVSTGGPKALAAFLPPLCESVNIPIFIVQHMPSAFTRSLAASLDKKCRYTILEGRNDQTVRDRHAYIAPGDRHMLVRIRENDPVVVINQQPPENGSRPSADVLFRSAAAVYGKRALALILTGMGADGTKGAGAVKRAGGRVIAQDEATSVVWGMPGSAVASGHVDEVAPLEKLPEIVFRIVSR
jgi:two-component system chemotaxis response regulator CheB